MFFDLIFPVRGEQVPTDHAYSLYGALSRIVREFHDKQSGLHFLTLNGVPAAPRLLQLTDRSRLRVRLPDDQIRLALPLAGKRLDLDGHTIRLGVPSVATLEPAATLWSRIVTIKHSWQSPHERSKNANRPNLNALPRTLAEASSPDKFLDSVRRGLAQHGIDGEPTLPLTLSGPRAGQPRRRVLRIHGKAIVGYSLLVAGLSAEHSLRLQELGLGGRGRLGCGFFLPAREGK
ncbi:MAG TPA: type I-MYXAN CRISPR-associated protein Cas6/Cmx6 [Gemmataceae bacterium]